MVCRFRKVLRCYCDSNGVWRRTLTHSGAEVRSRFPTPSKTTWGGRFPSGRAEPTAGFVFRKSATIHSVCTLWWRSCVHELTESLSLLNEQINYLCSYYQVYFRWFGDKERYTADRHFTFIFHVKRRRRERFVSSGRTTTPIRWTTRNNFSGVPVSCN